MQVTETSYRPSCLVADSAGAITKGFASAMGYGVNDLFYRVVCWQHVKRNIEKHLNLVSKENNCEIKEDIYVLQACQNSELFNKAVELFGEKWKAEKAFLTYFTKIWLNEKRRGWFQGYATSIPDHINNNEADNRWINEG